MLRSFAKEEGTTVDLLWQLLDDMMQESYDDISGKPALSQYYSSDGSYEWSPCTILTFDSRRQLFRIRWARTRKQKWVSRLNLRLEEEDLASWIRKTKLIRILERDKSRFETRNKWMAEAMPTLEETKMRDDDAFMERTRSACLAMARNSKVPFPERLASFREPKRRLGQQHPTHPLTHSHNISSHPIPSHPIPFHPIPSHSIPFHSIPFHPPLQWNNLLRELQELYRRSHLTASLYNKYDELGCGDLVLLPEEQLSRPWRERQKLTNEEHLSKTERKLMQSILEMGIKPPVRRKAPARVGFHHLAPTISDPSQLTLLSCFLDLSGAAERPTHGKRAQPFKVLC